MKKITTLAAVAAFGLTSLLAQTQRTILYEEFTGENCPPCASTNPWVDAAINPSFGNQILLLRYQTNIPSAPGAGSLYADNSTESNARKTYYSVPFAPYARFNGIELQDPGGTNHGHAILIHQQYYPGIITDSAIVNAPFGITVSHSFNATGDSITINATVTGAMTYNSSALLLQISLSESEIHFATAPGTNGEKDFYHVMRKMIPNNLGTALQAAWTNGATQNFNFKIKIPTYIKDKSKIEIVGWVEESTSKRVHNAGYSAPQALPLDASVASIDNQIIICNTTITPVTTITNPGATTLTSCLVNYKIDAGTVNTYTWTGSLATGATQQVTLPNLTTTAGTHTLTIYTSAPNGSTDVNSGNDQKTMKIIVQSTATPAPIVEGFVASTFPPANWAINNPDGGTYTWKRSTAAGGYGTTMNSTYIQFYNNANDGDIDELFMPQSDLTTVTSPTLKFDYAYNYYDDGTDILYDSLEVMLSTDCGVTWNQLFLDGGPGLTTAATAGNSNAYTPTSTEWQTQTLSLNAYASATAVLIKFVARNHYGNNLYLDNINLSAAVGIASQSAINSLGVYPNPAGNQAYLKLNLAASEKINVNMYNSMGQQVYGNTYDLAAGEHKLGISTEKLASGLYTILVNGSQLKLTVNK